MNSNPSGSRPATSAAAAKLSWEDKREQRFQRWLSPPGAQFSSPDAEKSYRARATRFIRAIRVQEPDRVPCILPAGQFPAAYAGITVRTAMYDYDEMKRAWRKFIRDFEGDTCPVPGISIPSGRVNELTKTKMTVWPGHGLPEDAFMAQFVEGEYMKADEYDVLLDDPGDFFLRIYLPRTMGAFEGFAKLMPFKRALGMPASFLGPCALPEVQAAFQAVIDASKELGKFRQVIGEITKEAQAAGFPPLFGGFAHAPFDLFGDTLRGTHGIMMDMFRQPKTLLDAMDAITSWIVDGAVAGANLSGVPLIFMALHKGDDTFMSEKQFDTFYWPQLRNVILGLLDAGLVPLLFAEGTYNKRLAAVTDLPKGSVVWWFDRTDMSRAKKILGEQNCISGNVPTSLICTGTPQDVKEYCRKLIEVCAPGGGYILNGGASVHNSTPANLRAMMEAAKEYGVYT
jgi:uroporphyrinogen-III decarboxylase